MTSLDYHEEIEHQSINKFQSGEELIKKGRIRTSKQRDDLKRFS